MYIVFNQVLKAPRKEIDMTITTMSMNIGGFSALVAEFVDKEGPVRVHVSGRLVEKTTALLAMAGPKGRILNASRPTAVGGVDGWSAFEGTRVWAPIGSPPKPSHPAP